MTGAMYQKEEITVQRAANRSLNDFFFFFFREKPCFLRFLRGLGYIGTAGRRRTICVLEDAMAKNKNFGFDTSEFDRDEVEAFSRGLVERASKKKNWRKEVASWVALILPLMALVPTTITALAYYKEVSLTKGTRAKRLRKRGDYVCKLLRKA